MKRRYITWQQVPTQHEFNLIAVSVNEYLTESVVDANVPYIEDAFAD